MSMPSEHQRQWLFFGGGLLGCIVIGCALWAFIVWEPPPTEGQKAKELNSSFSEQHANDPPTTTTTFPESLAPQVVWANKQLGLVIYCDNGTAIYKWNGEQGVVVPISDKCQPR